MKFYLDTSVIVPLFVAEVWSEHAEALLISGSPICLVSDYAQVEYASAISRRLRASDITVHAAQTALAEFDAWITGVETGAVIAADLALAKAFLRRLDLPVKTGDAIHLAAAQRNRAVLATFDRQLAESAAVLGIPVVP